MFSVIVPAHNEAQVIGRCLRTMLKDRRPDEFEVIVVANGCTDDTAAIARTFGDAVQVVETPIGSKIHALNLGDDHARGYPRMYVDADIVVSSAALRDVASMLGDDSPILAAAPRAIVAFQDRPWLVRSFCKVWTSLPYWRDDMIGAGFYAFSRRGRERFGRFPDVIGDDAYARLVVSPSERKASRRSTFTISPPTSLRAIARIMSRVRAGNQELLERFGDLHRHQTTDAGRSLRTIASMPRLWPHAPVYLGVMLVAELRARRKLRTTLRSEWERDDTSREAPAPGGSEVR